MYIPSESSHYRRAGALPQQLSQVSNTVKRSTSRGVQTTPRYTSPYAPRNLPDGLQDHRAILTMVYNTHASSLCPFSPWMISNVGVSAARSGCDASRLLQSIAKCPPSAKAESWYTGECVCMCVCGGGLHYVTYCALVVCL